jgi:Fe-S cluster biogenesis protein NfuA
VRGLVCSVPETLDAPLRDGTVSRVAVGENHVDVTLAPGRSWRVDGPRLRSALLAALESPAAWVTTGLEESPRADHDGSGSTLDERLTVAARAALQGEVGDLARSHGGALELDSVQDGVVTVQMTGACHGCPAAGLTLHARLERILKEQCPELREVRSASPGPGRAPWTWLRPGRPDGDDQLQSQQP